MATTDSRLSAALLDALEAARIPYAILHREADAAAGLIESDIDVVVGRPVTEVALKIATAVRHENIGLALIWPYDTNSLTTFWLTRDCRSGVQLDLLYDPKGKGRYGIKTDAALRRTERGSRWLRLQPEIEQIYLLSKRWDKGDSGQVRELAGNTKKESMINLANEILAPHGTRRIQAAMIGHRPTRELEKLRIIRGLLSRRAWFRLRYPVGVLLRLSGDQRDVIPVLEHVRRLLHPIFVKTEITVGLSTLKRARRWLDLRRPYLLLCANDVGTCPDINLPIDSTVHIDHIVEKIWHSLGHNAKHKLEMWENVYSS